MKPCKIPDYLELFLDQPFEAVLATSSRDGCPQQTVMWFARDGDTLVMTTLRHRVKIQNLQRDSRASLLIFGPGSYVSFRGEVEIVEGLETAERHLAILLERYLPAEEREKMLDKLKNPTRVTLRFLPGELHSHRVRAWTKSIKTSPAN